MQTSTGITPHTTPVNDLRPGDRVIYPGWEGPTVVDRVRKVTSIVEYPENRVIYFEEGGYGIVSRSAEVRRPNVDPAHPATQRATSGPQHETQIMPCAADVLAIAEHLGTDVIEADGWANTLIPYPGGSTVVYKAPTDAAVS